MKPNSVYVKFANITNLQNFVNAEKLKDENKLEIWDSSLSEKSLTIPIYLSINAKESDYVESHEEVYTEPPAHTFRTDDLDDYSDIEVVKCPTDQELTSCD